MVGAVSVLSLAAGPRPALAARYRVLLTPVDARHAPPRVAQWCYVRDERQLRHSVEGQIDRVWNRAPDGRLQFRKLRHAPPNDARVWAQAWGNEPGATDWQALTSLIGDGDLRHLLPDRTPQRDPVCQAYTLAAAGLVDLVWDTSWQLPRRMTRLLPGGTLTHTLLSVEAG